jgi:hypothetical protein
MHIAQRDPEAKSTPKLRDVKETNQECSFPWLAIETVHSIKVTCILSKETYSIRRKLVQIELSSSHDGISQYFAANLQLILQKEEEILIWL